jgi:hypothetical protein
MARWTAFADLSFADSAWLAFARAAELAETDAHEQHRAAWVIDDNRIQVSLTNVESGRSMVEGLRRFLGLLALQAVDGEVRIDVLSPRESWVRTPAAASARTERAISGLGPTSSTVRAEPSESGVSELDPVERLFALASKG